MHGPAGTPEGRGSDLADSPQEVLIDLQVGLVQDRLGGFRR